MDDEGRADEPDEVPDLAPEIVAVRLEERDEVHVRAPGPDRVVEVEQVALQGGEPSGRQHDPVPADRHQPCEERHEAEDDR